MTNDTLRVRLATLMKKSLKAAALYAQSAEEAARTVSLSHLESQGGPSTGSSPSVSLGAVNLGAVNRGAVNRGAVSRGASPSSSLRTPFSSSRAPTGREMANRNLAGGLHFGIDSDDTEFLPVHEGPSHRSEDGFRKGEIGVLREDSVQDREGFERPLIDRQLALQQTLIWKQVNEELSHALRKLLRLQSARELSQQAVALRDALYNAWRRVESDLHNGRQELLAVIERDQFVKAAVLSERLAGLRARFQASKAALNEYESVVGDVLRRGISTEERRDGASSSSQDSRDILIGRDPLSPGDARSDDESASELSSADSQRRTSNSTVIPFRRSSR